LQPYCNLISVTVVQQGGQYQLDGTDNQCGNPQAASVQGLAFFNPNGTIGFGLTIVTAPGGTPVHVDATIDIVTLGGTWRDSLGNTGTFVFTPGAPVAGSPRPSSTDVRFRIIDLISAQTVSAVAALTNWSATPVYNVGGGTYNQGAGSYTVPSAGLYLITATVRWQPFATVNVNSYKCTFIFVGASTRAATTCDIPSSAQFDIQNISTVTTLAAGDVLTIRAFQNSGGTGTVGTAGIADATWTVTRLRQ
jgi:hypothetical protein